MSFFKIIPSAKPAAVVLIFIAGCLLSSARIFRDAPSIGRVTQDEVAKRSDQRFATLRAELPSRGVVGYVGESGNAGTEAYYLAQYALAPLVLERSKDHSLVIVSISPMLPLPDTKGLELVKNYGDGLLLFSNKDAR